MMVEENQNGAAPKILEQLVHQAERAGASDIHLQMRGKTAEVNFRLDGIIAPGTELPADVADRVFGRIKFLARLKTYQDSLPQDGRIARDDLGSKNDIRVATYPTVTGEKIVLRLFNSSPAISLREFPLPAAASAELEQFLGQSTGLLLLTGPAGSGKTTTIYACLRHLVEPGGRQIITVEDTVEQIVPGTMHAGSCRGVFERLLVMCADHSAAASVVELVLNQRLIRKLCSACGGAGCDVCLRTGYQGRVPLVEWLRVDEAMRAKIRQRELTALVPARPLEESARELLQQGLSNQAEYQRVFGL